MKKSVSFKMFFTVLWRGICRVFGYIGRFFGYKSGCSFFKVLWRIVATCLTVLVVIFTALCLAAFADSYVVARWITPRLHPVWNSYNLSNHIVFQNRCGVHETRIYDMATGRTLVEDVDWVVVSDDHDSLAVFAKEGKRGYINRFSGEIVIEPEYTRAWVFSEGLAAVEKDGKLRFIDREGRTVIDKGLEVHPGLKDYVFQNGYCRMRNAADGNIGLIDRSGEWALEPRYHDIYRLSGVWVVETDDDREAVLDDSLNVILPLSDTEYYVYDDVIVAASSNHVISEYDLRGNPVNEFMISEVSQMTYPTSRLVYDTTATDDNGDLYASSTTPVSVCATARCLRYEAESGWYGLMTPAGKVVTQPEYISIEAIGPDIYLCIDGTCNGVLLDGRGQKVQ